MPTPAETAPHLLAEECSMQAVLDALSTSIAVLDADGKIERVNDAWKQQVDDPLPFPCRFQKGDLLSGAPGGAPSDQTPNFWTCLRAVQERRVDRTSELVRCESNGEVRTFRVTVTRPRGGFSDRLVIACEDVTTARSHEHKAKLLEKAFETATEGILITDALQSNHPIVYVNSGFEKLSGYNRNEVIGRSCRFMRGDETDPNTVAEIREAIKAGETCHVELINHRKDGTPFWNELRLAPIVSEDGSVEHYVGVQSDITARKQSEHELRESRARFDRAVRGSSEALWEWDSTTGEIWFSPLWLEMLGYEAEELPQHFETFERLLHKDDREPTVAALLRHVNEQEPYDVEYRLKTKSGTYRWFRARGVAEFEEDGTPKRMSGSAQDITQRRATEALLRDKEAQLRHKQRMEAVGSLAGGIAHEFNNLLHVIKGYTEFAFEQYEQDATIDLDDLREALSASDRATKLTRQLLDFSRSEEPQLTLQDTNRIVAELKSLIRPLLGEQIEFRTRLCDSPVPLLADRTLFTQALMNLCVNARDAMSDGGTLTLCTECIEIDRQAAELRAHVRPGRYVRLSLTDTGCGIQDDVIGRIFDPFFTTKEAGKGTGMGLAFTYSVVEQHLGHIDVSSEPGVGTTFDVYIPLHATEAEIELVPEADNEMLPQKASLILVAEDEKAVLKVATRTLERAGHITIAAENGEEAVQKFRQNADRIALVLLDVMMPKLSGRAALEEIRRIRPDVPAVFCTGYEPNSQQLAGASQSGIPIIEKPFDRKTLLGVVQSVLNGEQEHQAADCLPSPADRLLSPAEGLPPTAATRIEPEITAPVAHEELLERCMGSLEFAQELLSEFEAGLVGRLETLTSSFKKGNAEEVSKTAHTLKGAAGIIGAEGLRRVAASIEKSGESGRLEEMAPLLRELTLEASRFYEAMPETRRKLAKQISV